MTIIEAAPFDAAAPIVGRTIMQRGRAVMALLAVAVAAGIPSTASATTPPIDPVVTELATFAAPACAGGGGSGSTVGPDKALYVTDGPGGRVLRVDSETGTVTTFARGLPPAIPEVGIGGAIDVVFAGGSAYGSSLWSSHSSARTTSSTASTGSRTTALRPRSRISARGRCRILPRPPSSSPAASSTRWSSTAADSWSQTGTTTACCGSREPVTSARRWRSAISSPRASRSMAGQSTWERPAPSRISRRTARS